MKRILLLVFIGIFVAVSNIYAQTIPPTTGHNICYKCLPTGWTNAIGGNEYAIADRTYYGSVNIPFIGPKPVIPGTPVLPPIPSGATTFFGIHGGYTRATISNLVAGQKYKFSYSVISTQANLQSSGGIDFSDDFTTEIFFRIRQEGQYRAIHKHEFQKDKDHSVWRSGVFEFTSTATTAEFELETPGEVGDISNKVGFIGLDLGPNTITPCGAGVTAVPLKATSYEILCPETSVNLVSQFFGGLIPSGTELRFFTNPDHSGLPLSNVNVGAGTYYAFYYDAANNCYNQDVSTAKIDVTYRNCVDLTPTLIINGLSFAEGASRDFVVKLYEVNNRETSGTTSFRITKVGGFNITYPTENTLSNVAGGTQNQNKNWTFNETTNFITATSNVPIPANGNATIGFKIQRKTGISKGLTQNITPTILTGAGGDSNAKNNNSVTSVSTN
ncbi:hypothetical protein [Dyadobacter sp.]|uniref:hypothetical protein n=1 Tax=Dyadobacter sp. TaxID=1914288 RepID=UPI003F706F98